MHATLTIRQARLVLGRRVVTGDVLVEDGVITSVSARSSRLVGEVIEAEGRVCIPGVIDTWVAARAEVRPGEPEDLGSVSLAAVSAGVTSFLGLPSPTATLSALQKKVEIASARSRSNFGFYVGMTSLETEAAEQATSAAAVALSWCETSAAQRELAFKAARRVAVRNFRDPGKGGGAALGEMIGLASKHGVRLHVMGLETRDELEIFGAAADARLTGSIALPTLASGELRGPRGQREALWAALRSDERLMVGSDHGCAGRDEDGSLPGIEWLLPLVGDQAASGACTWPLLTRWLCSGPADAFSMSRKGRIEVGYDADLVLVDTSHLHQRRDAALSRAGWCPYAGRTYAARPVLTVVGGQIACREGRVDPEVRGRAVSFD